MSLYIISFGHRNWQLCVTRQHQELARAAVLFDFCFLLVFVAGREEHVHT